jgi:hypothetical protein
MTKPVFFFFAGALGDTLRFADGRDPVVSWSQIISDDQPDFDAFEISFAGFTTAVSTSPLRRNGVQMIDRIRVIELTTSLGPFRIVFDWNGDPQSAPSVA